MLYLDAGTCKRLDPRSLRCPDCGESGSMVRHGAYWRRAVRLDGLATRVERVCVERVRCRRCGRTHAVLPSDLVGGSALSVEVCMLILVMCRMAAGHREVAARLGVSLSSVARADGDAARVAVLVEATAWGLAWDLSTLAEDPAFPLRFAGLHGTTPFSRLPAQAARMCREREHTGPAPRRPPPALASCRGRGGRASGRDWRKS